MKKVHLPMELQRCLVIGCLSIYGDIPLLLQAQLQTPLEASGTIEATQVRCCG